MKFGDMNQVSFGDNVQNVAKFNSKKNKVKIGITFSLGFFSGIISSLLASYIWNIINPK
jgi:hypothetical protein